MRIRSESEDSSLKRLFCVHFFYEVKMNQQILKILIQETNKAMSKNEVPIGCVITRNSEIISKAHNQKI